MPDSLVEPDVHQRQHEWQDAEEKETKGGEAQDDCSASGAQMTVTR